LGFATYSQEVLETIYRCSQEVVDFSRRVLNQQPAPISTKSDPHSIRKSEHHSQAQAIDEIAEQVAKLMQAESFASVAILCKDSDSSHLFHQHLREMIDCRLIKGGDFSFSPGVDICTVREAKGLEFDYVIIPDLEAYSESLDDRRLLHVAVTRCVEQLWLLGVGIRAQKWFNLLKQEV
jgi:DNA helicase II / ATP-dependent DNA helicase PcrA